MLFDTFNDLDRLGLAILSTMPGRTAAAPVNLTREPDRYVLDADLPGVDPDSIDVSVDDGWLTIQADRSTTSQNQGGRWLLRERSDVSWMRRFALGQDVDADKIEAAYHNGVLRVVIPIAEGARPRKVQVALGPARAGGARPRARRFLGKSRARAAGILTGWSWRSRRSGGPSEPRLRGLIPVRSGRA